MLNSPRRVLAHRPTRHHRIPRVYICKELKKKYENKKISVYSMRSVPDLMKLGAHNGLG